MHAVKCFKFSSTKNDSAVVIEVLPSDPRTQFIVYLKRDSRASKDNHDYNITLPNYLENENVTDKSKVPPPFKLFLSNVDLNHTAAGEWFFCVEFNGTVPLRPTLRAESSDSDNNTTDTLWDTMPLDIANFTVSTLSTGCRFWNASTEEFSGDGCEVRNYKRNNTGLS